MHKQGKKDSLNKTADHVFSESIPLTVKTGQFKTTSAHIFILKKQAQQSCRLQIRSHVTCYSNGFIPEQLNIV